MLVFFVFFFSFPCTSRAHLAYASSLLTASTNEYGLTTAEASFSSSPPGAWAMKRKTTHIADGGELCVVDSIGNHSFALYSISFLLNSRSRLQILVAFGSATHLLEL